MLPKRRVDVGKNVLKRGLYAENIGLKIATLSYLAEFIIFL